MAPKTSQTDPEKPKTSPKEGSPADERKYFLSQMLHEREKTRLDQFEREIATELKEEESERERLSLLNSVLDQRQTAEIEAHLKTLQDQPGEESPEKAEALMYFRDTFPYLLAVLSLKYKIDPNSTVSEFIKLASKTRDPQELALLSAMVFLEENSDLPSSKAYHSQLLPGIRKDSLVLYDAAKEVLDEKVGAGTWMKEKIKAHPFASAALLTVGAVAAYQAGKWLYNKARKKQEVSDDGGAKATEKKPGIFSRLTSGWSFVKKATVSTALFTGGLLVAGRVLGMDGVEDYLKKNGIEWPYKNRFLAAITHFTYGEMEEGLATLNFGPRTDEERGRHEVYAEFFGVSDHAVWLTAGLNFSKLMNADPERQHPLSSGVFASVPFISKYFELPEQIEAEEVVKGKLDEKLDLIHERIPAADSMTVDKVLKKAFELHLFDAKESAGWAGYSDELHGTIEGLESDTSDYASRVDAATKGKETLEFSDIEALKSVRLELAEDLEKLRLSRPSYWLEMKSLMERVVPWMTMDDSELQDLDYLRAKDGYKSFFEKAEQDDMDAIGVDMKELEKIGAFFQVLTSSKPLSPEQKVLLQKHCTALKQIKSRINDSLIRSKVTRDRAVKEDAGEGWTDIDLEDLKELGAVYFHTYQGVWYGLEWSVEELVNENTGIKGKVLGFTGVAISGLAAGSIAFDVVQGAMLVNNGKTLSGLARMTILPGHSLPLFAYYHIRSNPAALLEKVIKGKMDPAKALRYCQVALKKSDVFWEDWYRLGGKAWGDRMRYLKTLTEIFDNRAHLQWLEGLIDGGTVLDRRLLKPGEWDSKFVDLIEKGFKIEFDDFIVKMRKERGTGKILIDTLERIPAKEKIMRFFEEMARKLGRPVLPRSVMEQWFIKGGEGLKFLSYYLRKGMPVGVALLTVYWVCDETYNARDKGERIALAALGLVAAEVGWQAAYRAATAVKFTPKHPIITVVVALAAAIGVSVVVEEAAAPYLKDPGTMATAIRGIGAPVLYTAGGGHLVDAVGHYYNTTNDEEKKYFTRETYLPLIGTRKMAFHDGAFLSGGSYFEEVTPEDAVGAWNYQVREKIAALRAEEKASDGTEKPIDHSDKIAELDLKIIDGDWNFRQIKKIESQKAEIIERGMALNDKILGAYASSMTPVEKALVESLLVGDIPESWIDESFQNLEDNQRYATVMKFAKELDQEDELLTFVERKRLIQSDVSFYRSIGREQAIMHPTQEERLIAVLGIDPALVDKATRGLDELMDELGLNEEDLAETA